MAWKGKGHWRIGTSLRCYGDFLVKRGRYEEAASALHESHETLEASLDTAHPQTIKAVRSLVALYDAWGKPDEALMYRKLLSAED